MFIHDLWAWLIICGLLNVWRFGSYGSTRCITNMRKLTLFIPGFFGPVSKTLFGMTPDVPAIEKYFRFGASKSIQATGFTQTLFELFDFPKQKYDYPVAAITRLVDDDHDLEGFWMRADPVHLRPERDAVVLLDDSAFNLEKHEALILAADLQQVFTERDIELEAPTINRWYIKLKQLPEISTKPIHEVVNNDIDKNRASGENKILWDQLSNEAQMSLYNCPLNDEREQRGELPVNGIWLWGAGELPKFKKQIWSCVFADEVTTQGLSILTGSPYMNLPESLEDLINQSGEQDNVLAVISFGLRHKQYFDHNGWQDFIAYIEEEWFADIEKLIKQKELDELTLLTESHYLTVTKSSFMKFWRRHKPLHSYSRN